MKRQRRKFVFSALAMLYFFSQAVIQAETFRVHELFPLTITDISSEPKAVTSINDALSIELPEDLTYINGIELHIKIPEDVAAWRDTIAYSLYNGIEPRPQKDKIDYSGERISVNTLPGKLSLVVYIPIANDFTIKESPYHVIISAIPNIKNHFIFFRMQLAMKGVPESFESAQFEISAKPVLRNVGTFTLIALEPNNDNKGFQAFIDGEAVDENTVLLETGEHQLSIHSEYYRDEVRTFRIDQAQTTTLEVVLRSIEPTLRVISPENARVYYDGTLLENTREAFVVIPGEHSIKFVIGDYEVVKNVTVVNGRSYTVNLSVDASVSETD